MFDYYLATQLALVDATTGESRYFSDAAVYDYVSPSPNGKFILLVSIGKPYSRVDSPNYFPRKYEIVDVHGNKVRTLYSRPPGVWGSLLQGWAPSGNRRYAWVPFEGATLAYVEALDRGDPRSDSSHRDRLLLLSAPFTGEPIEVTRFRGRVVALPESRRFTWDSDGPVFVWAQRGAWVEEFDYGSGMKRIWHVNLHASRRLSDKQLLFEVNYKDSENDPGRPLLVGGTDIANPTAQHDKQWIYLAGRGGSSEGDRPFIDRFNLVSQQRERLHASAGQQFEQVLMALDARSFISRIESPTDPPNYFRRDIERRTVVALTHANLPLPQLRTVSPKLLTYVRKDGVRLSGTLYRPAHAEGRLPTLIWAYPISFGDSQSAGRVRGSPYRYLWDTEDPLKLAVCLLVLDGFSVLWNASMPVVGGERANDTAVKQFVANAEAAAQALVDGGMTDPSKIAIGGHSYGATMAALLLANTRAFSAGVAISGAYNMTLMPAGFQEEGRTLWQAPDAYMQLSALLQADRVNSPLLLIHGDQDSTAMPIESERMFQALSSLGHKARFVRLPFEGHVPRTQQSLGHINWEMSEWLAPIRKPN